MSDDILNLDGELVGDVFRVNESPDDDESSVFSAESVFSMDLLSASAFCLDAALS